MPTTRCRRVITGNSAVAYGAFLSRAQVVAAYPITPQTSIIESLADLVAGEPGRTRFIPVESEHSALSACIGASLAGARAFTATSSQGLLYMHEVIHWAAGGRLPLVMVNVNRAVAPGWNIWSDQNDSLSQRDTGWMQLYVTSAQEALDGVILSFRVAEQVQIPVMPVLDAFSLSHTAEPVEIPPQELVDEFLPPRQPAFRADPERPASFGGLLSPDHYQQARRRLHEEMVASLPTWEQADLEWQRLTGRRLPLVEPYRCQGAEVVLVASATPSVTAEEVVDELRDQGLAVGLLRLRLFRPFPQDSLCRLLAGVPRVAVLDRNCSYGHHGIWMQECKSALYSLEAGRPQVYGYIAGLGGRDLTPALLREVFTRTLARPRPQPETVWL
ncbi:MAG TPA: pyruvate ferredoxin oxidoreductase [Candidatus Nitrosotenuis sp.]|nr:pyruvate ferredoxin oxidoreductase [Candidatus Nitrosotenuis sp.]